MPTIFPLPCKMTVVPLLLHVLYASSQARNPLASLIGLAIGGAGGGIAVGLWHIGRMRFGRRVASVALVGAP
jgi:hypothetical protein